MRIIKHSIVSILMILIATSALSFASNDEMRGLWVASVYGIDYPSKPSTNPDVLKAEADKIIQTAVDAGMNAIFLQVRPTGDALYDSDIFPWSKFLTGTEGIAPENGFDPLAYWIERAHENGIELHAWINPYRVTRDMSKTETNPFSKLSSYNPAKLSQDLLVRYTDGNLYYNPGLPEVEKLIVSGIEEILKSYDVDGIHFDDYFYPGSDFEDSKAYQTYAYSGESKDDFRRRVVTHLVKTVDASVHAVDPSVRFGISPFGIWANAAHLSGGSATRGNESYFSHYADTKYWVEQGYVDYIAPQIYWNIGFEIADYEVLAKWWSNVVANTDVDLYIGHAAYRTQYTDSSSAWYGVNEIKKQMTFNQTLAHYGGSIFYNYSAFETNSDLITTVKAFSKPTVKYENLYPAVDELVVGDTVRLYVYAQKNILINTNIFGRFYFFTATNETNSNGLTKFVANVPKIAFKGAETYRPLYRLRYDGENHDLESSGILILN